MTTDRALVALVNAWRDLARDQDIIIGTKELSEAEHDWHEARSQQAEDCADELEAVLAAMQQPDTEPLTMSMFANKDDLHAAQLAAKDELIARLQRDADDFAVNGPALVSKIELGKKRELHFTQRMFEEQRRAEAAEQRAEAAMGLLETASQLLDRAVYHIPDMLLRAECEKFLTSFKHPTLAGGAAEVDRG